MENSFKNNHFKSSTSFMEFINKIRPGSYDAHSFKSEYSYLCYIALYQFATQFCKEKTVLDAACGLGYGSYLLAQNAEKVTGIEIIASNIDFSLQNYQKDNLIFLVADATAMNFRDGQFDVVVSIETFEHIPPTKALQFLEEFRRVLKPGGTLVIS
ncbi:MAG: class I SAM-dependent methyltransferase, partial [Calditrichaeota bacterium]|nr:class I SAM-dependent methyltransferase [Calditrichota bacterium]